MRHAAPKAHKAAGTKSLTNLFTTHHGSHSPQAVYAEKAAAGNAEALGIDEDLAAKLNEVAPLTRRSIRESAKAAQRRNTVLTSASLAALVGTAATSMAFMKSQDDTTTMFPAAGAETTQTMNITRVNDGAASRSDTREALTDGLQGAQNQGAVGATTTSTTNEGGWDLGDSNAIADVNALTKAKANNSKVAERVDKDEANLPDGFNPNHPTGDTGNQYPWGQCTWWSYERRHQLGLNTGSFFGDARSWALPRRRSATGSTTRRAPWATCSCSHRVRKAPTAITAMWPSSRRSTPMDPSRSRNPTCRAPASSPSVSSRRTKSPASHSCTTDLFFHMRLPAPDAPVWRGVHRARIANTRDP